MRCPKCNGKTHVVETFNDAEEIHRLRQCCGCKEKFLTVEEEVHIGLLTDLWKYKKQVLKARKENHETVR